MNASAPVLLIDTIDISDYLAGNDDFTATDGATVRINQAGDSHDPAAFAALLDLNDQFNAKIVAGTQRRADAFGWVVESAPADQLYEIRRSRPWVEYVDLTDAGDRADLLDLNGAEWDDALMAACVALADLMSAAEAACADEDCICHEAVTR